MRLLRRLGWCVAAVACGLIVAGCGHSGPEIVPVRGRITLDGGQWPKAGTLYFAPAKPAEGLPRRPGVAHFDVDGRFSVTTLDPDDGLIPGIYRVAVECWEVPPSHEAGRENPGRSYVAAAYCSPAKSDLELTIEKGSEPIEVEYDVPRAKP